MKPNPDKSQFIIPGNTGSITLQIVDITIKSIIIDSKLNFQEYVNNPLRRLRKFLTLEKVKMLACLMIDSQFAYWPLIWMFFSKTDM